jgi:DNA-binding XRE family transcriptional regulator
MMLGEIPTDRELTAEEWLAVEIPITPLEEQLERSWQDNTRLIHEVGALHRQNTELRAALAKLQLGAARPQPRGRIDRSTLAARLVAARKAVQLTQEEAAAAVGLTRANLGMMETARTAVNDEHIHKLAQLYHVSIGWLFGEI